MLAASGRIKEATGSYLVMFIIAGLVYFLGLAAMHLLVPRLQRAEIGWNIFRSLAGFWL